MPVFSQNADRHIQSVLSLTKPPQGNCSNSMHGRIKRFRTDELSIVARPQIQGDSHSPSRIACHPHRAVFTPSWMMRGAATSYCAQLDNDSHYTCRRKSSGFDNDDARTKASLADQIPLFIECACHKLFFPGPTCIGIDPVKD